MMIEYLIHGVAALCVLNLVACTLAGDQLTAKGRRGRLISVGLLALYAFWLATGGAVPAA